MIRRSLYLLLLAGCIFIFPASLKRCTHSFHAQRLIVDLPDRENWKTVFHIPQEEIYAILSQPFEYLNRGSQAFVFASIDGKYVLKLYLFESPKETLMNSFFHRQDYSRSDYAALRSIKTLNALAAADHYVPEQTGLVFAHLNLTSDNLPLVHLSGPAWHRMQLDLNRVRFVLQRRVRPLAEPLIEAYLNNDRQRFDSLIREIDSLLSQRIACQIRNADPTLFDNFGFLEDRAVEIDFGNYAQGCCLNEKSRYVPQLLKWAEKNTPRWKDDVAQLIRDNP